MRKDGPRILHAPLDVGGHAFGLSRAERELGLRSDVAVVAPGPFGYERHRPARRPRSSRLAALRPARRLSRRRARKYDSFTSTSA